MKNRMRKTILILIFCIAALGQLLFASGVFGRDLGEVIHKKNSLYHSIFVYQRGSVITLKFGRQDSGGIQSQVNTKNLRKHMLEYTKLSFCGLLYNPEPKRMLVVGLGGGVIPRDMRHYFPELEIDVVDIDPEIPLIANKFFGFATDDKLRVHIDDGRMFIKKYVRRKAAAKYDMVILDAFNGDYIPFHLMTKEFLDELKSVVSDDGVVIANLFSSNSLFDAEMKTFLAVFGRCQFFFGNNSGNAMLVALGPNRHLLDVKEALVQARNLQEKLRLSFNMEAVANRLEPKISPAPEAKVLTDDRAPVNWLRKQETQKSPKDSGSTTEEQDD